MPSKPGCGHPSGWSWTRRPSVTRSPVRRASRLDQQFVLAWGTEGPTSPSSAPMAPVVETPSVNAPAIAACERLGFEPVGFDTSLYDGTPAGGDTAVYLARGLVND